MSDWIGGRTSATSTTPVLSARSCSTVERSRSSISTPGRLRRKRCTAAGTIESSAEPTNDTRSSPVWPASIARAVDTATSSSASMARASRRKASPAGVSSTRRRVRSSSVQPSSASSAPNLLAERRLGDVQPRGGTPEVQLLGDGDEIAELAEFHDLDPMAVTWSH